MTKPLPQDINILKDFGPITLSEMDGVKLMNRTDTKFVFKRQSLNEFLEILNEQYKVLNIKENLISSYKTLYFDTPEFQFFRDHHNGKGNRFKVRIRNYVESNLYFLEIKNKYKGRTAKSRIKLPDFELDLKKKSNSYITEVIGDPIHLESKLWNNFNRITLVNNNEKERLTLDLDLSFDWDGRTVNYGHVVIAELKQENANRNSLFYSIMKKNGIRPNGMSKYCVGTVALYPDQKYNNFKEKILLIDKLI
ncbi:MAG: polyphosphate polymerase domain-containing protein [Crocinitomix sp.]|nr:polyphosphate polymerase domain-containing protein [Crocinitomix sp.]|tara:strand:+ start:131 stop:883 length:753 start_codon:yes stop_codon:yes gene_type:complete